MFTDFFVRLTLDQVEDSLPLFLERGLRPEIYIGNQHLAGLGRGEIRGFARLLSAFPAHTLHAPFMDIAPGAKDAEVRALSFAKMEKAMEIAAAWGSRLVVMHYNYDPIYYRHSLGEWLERSADFYRRLLLPGRPARIALENVADPTPQLAGRLLAMIADPRAIPCIDLGHLHVFGTVTFADWLLFLAPQHALHFHFHDNDGGEDGHLPLGRGTIDWPGVRRLLERLQVPFSVGLEPHNGADLRRMLSAYRKFFLARKRATAGDAARRPAARTRGSHR